MRSPSCTGAGEVSLAEHARQPGVGAFPLYLHTRRFPAVIHPAMKPRPARGAAGIPRAFHGLIFCTRRSFHTTNEQANM